MCTSNPVEWKRDFSLVSVFWVCEFWGYNLACISLKFFLFSIGTILPISQGFWNIKWKKIEWVHTWHSINSSNYYKVTRYMKTRNSWLAWVFTQVQKKQSSWPQRKWSRQSQVCLSRSCSKSYRTLESRCLFCILVENIIGYIAIAMRITQNRLSCWLTFRSKF